MITTQENLAQLQRFLQDAINREIEYAISTELSKVAERIEKRRAEIIAGVILHVEKVMQMQTMDNRIIITVETK